MKKQPLVIAVIAVAVIGFGAWWYTNNQAAPAANQNVNTATSNANAVAPLPTSISYQGQDGKNALELLKDSHEVIESSGLVNGIDGRIGSRTAYWLYYVNGQAATVGAKDYVTKSTDTIEWRFEYAQ